MVAWNMALIPNIVTWLLQQEIVTLPDRKVLPYVKERKG